MSICYLNLMVPTGCTLFFSSSSICTSILGCLQKCLKSWLPLIMNSYLIILFRKLRKLRLSESDPHSFRKGIVNNVLYVRSKADNGAVHKKCHVDQKVIQSYWIEMVIRVGGCYTVMFSDVLSCLALSYCLFCLPLCVFFYIQFHCHCICARLCLWPLFGHIS